MTRSVVATWPTRSLLVVLFLAVLAQGIFFSQYIVPWEDEGGYLVLGAMSLRGEIRLFQDEMLGERLPLPFYVLGASQFVAGPNLVAARLLSLLTGLLAIWLVYRTGTVLGGALCGTLSALFLATQAMVVAYYATAMYFAFCSLIIAAGFYLLAVHRAPIASMVVFSLLSLTRPHLAVMVPVVLGYLLLRAPSRREQWLLLAVAALPPLIFFASSREHLKLLAYVPVLHHLVRPLGYESLFNLGGLAQAEAGESGWAEGRAIAWFIRRYVFWCAAGIGLTGGWLLIRLRSGGTVRGASSLMRFAVALLVYTLAWQVLILRHYPKSIAAWTASFSPLPALVLGYFAAWLVAEHETPGWLRNTVALGLAAVFAFSPTYSTHASMPNPLPPGGTTIALLGRLAQQVAEHVPPGSRVFLLGSPLPAYLVGARPYVQQIIHTWTLVPQGDPGVLRRSGLWGRADIEAWLGRDAPYALVNTRRLESLRRIRGYDELADLIESSLSAHFRLVANIDAGPLGTYRVYERYRPRQ